MLAVAQCRNSHFNILITRYNEINFRQLVDLGKALRLLLSLRSYSKDLERLTRLELCIFLHI